MMKKQYFLFLLNQEMYAINTLDVIEIVDAQNITKVPTMNKFIAGVTNIRGNLISVVNLAHRLNLKNVNPCEQTYFAILKKKYLDKELQIAVIIDEAFEVDEIKIENIESAPDLGTSIDKAFIKDMVKYADEYIVVLDIDVLLEIKDISRLTRVEG
jgi:purine-binding chemotaxis protein CheW